MALSREDIQRRYQSDREAAEAWREADPSRYAQEIEKAQDRRADALDALSAQSEQSARQANLASARAAALAKYPLAAGMSQFVTGDTAEAIEASAKTIHDSISAQREEAVKAAQVARRPQTRAAWTGNPNGVRPGVPGGELRQDTSAATEQVQRTFNRLTEVTQESSKPGILRTYSTDAEALLKSPDVEAQAIADRELIVPNTGMSLRAMRAKQDGAQFVPSGTETPEDNRG